MARPLSEAKRQAILAAATEQVAALGTGAPTAKIAQAAGVSEGTLFTYFATKEELLNQLFLQIGANLQETLSSAFPKKGRPRERMQRLWDALIQWGCSDPVRHKALRQLKVSDRVVAKSRQCSNERFAKLRKMVEETLAEHMDPERMPFYIGIVLDGLADITVETIAANPKEYEHFRQAGFDFYWKGIGV